MLQGEHSAILLNFIKLPFAIKIFVLSIFKLLFYTGFTVLVCFLFQSCIVAVVVPDPETIPKFAADKLGLKGEMSELCQSAVRHTPTIAWFFVIIGCPSSISPFNVSTFSFKVHLLNYQVSCHQTSQNNPWVVPFQSCSKNSIPCRILVAMGTKRKNY